MFIRRLFIVIQMEIITSTLCANLDEKTTETSTRFPYEFWRPPRMNEFQPQPNLRENISSYDGLHYSNENNRDVPMQSKWAVMPIQIPNDLLGEVEEPVNDSFKKGVETLQKRNELLPRVELLQTDKEYEYWKDYASDVSMEKVYLLPVNSTSPFAIMRDEPFSYYEHYPDTPLLVNRINKQKNDQRRTDEDQIYHRIIEPDRSSYQEERMDHHYLEDYLLPGDIIPVQNFYTVVDPLTKETRLVHVTSHEPTHTTLGLRPNEKPFRLNRFPFKPSYQFSSNEYKSHRKINEPPLEINKLKDNFPKLEYEDIYKNSNRYFNHRNKNDSLDLMNEIERKEEEKHQVNDVYIYTEDIESNFIDKNFVRKENQIHEDNYEPLFYPEEYDNYQDEIYSLPNPYPNNQQQFHFDPNVHREQMTSQPFHGNTNPGVHREHMTSQPFHGNINPGIHREHLTSQPYHSNNNHGVHHERLAFQHYHGNSNPRVHPQHITSQPQHSNNKFQKPFLPHPKRRPHINLNPKKRVHQRRHPVKAVQNKVLTTAPNIVEAPVFDIDVSPMLIIPGGLLALAAGLALYYFNFVWYPTPVVTARLVELLSEVALNDGWSSSDQEQAIKEVSSVFRGLEKEFSSNIWEHDCRLRIVCQAHKEFPSLWSMTLGSSIVYRSKLHLFNQDGSSWDSFLESARLGNEGKSCQEKYQSCRIPNFRLKPLLKNLLFSPTDV